MPGILRTKDDPIIPSNLKKYKNVKIPVSKFSAEELVQLSVAKPTPIQEFAKIKKKI